MAETSSSSQWLLQECRLSYHSKEHIQDISHVKPEKSGNSLFWIWCLHLVLQQSSYSILGFSCSPVKDFLSCTVCFITLQSTQTTSTTLVIMLLNKLFKKHLFMYFSLKKYVFKNELTMYLQNVIKNPNEDNHKTKSCESNNNSESWVGATCNSTLPSAGSLVVFLTPLLWNFYMSFSINGAFTAV